jgi:hypothetical protein
MIKAFVLVFFVANALFMWLSVDNSALPIPVRFVAFLLLALNLFTAAGFLAKGR